MPHDVFISYSSKDKAVADAASAKLEAAGIRCWLAPRNVLAGQNWGQAIVGAIKEARLMVLVFSAHANFSPQITREVERAASRGLAIIPLRIEDVKPASTLEYYISTAHWLDALSPPLEKHLQELTRVVSLLLHEPEPRPSQPNRLPQSFYGDPEQTSPSLESQPPQILTAKPSEDQAGLPPLVKRAASIADAMLRIFFGVLLLVLCVVGFYVYKGWWDSLQKQEVANNPPPTPLAHINRTSEPPENWVKVISISPDSPAVLRNGQILTVKVQYAAKEAKLVSLLADPYKRGNLVGYRPSRLFYQSAFTNASDGLAFFSCDGGTNIDKIKVRMTSDGKILSESSAPIQASWLHAGDKPPQLPTNADYFVSGRNWVRLVATAPASPATLASDQPLAVNVQYSVGDSAKANINIVPYASGSPTPWRPGKTTVLRPGLARSYFSCRATHVDQLEVEIHSISNKADSILAYFPVDLLWLDTPTPTQGTR